MPSVIVVTKQGIEVPITTSRGLVEAVYARGWLPKTGTVASNFAALDGGPDPVENVHLPLTTVDLQDVGSPASVALRAAFVPADPVLSDFVYDAAGNLTSYKEGGVTITLTYNADGTVATQQRGSGPVRSFSYSGGKLAGVA